MRMVLYPARPRRWSRYASWLLEAMTEQLCCGLVNRLVNQFPYGSAHRGFPGVPGEFGSWRNPNLVAAALANFPHRHGIAAGFIDELVAQFVNSHIGAMKGQIEFHDGSVLSRGQIPCLCGRRLWSPSGGCFARARRADSCCLRMARHRAQRYLPSLSSPQSRQTPSRTRFSRIFLMECAWREIIFFSHGSGAIRHAPGPRPGRSARPGQTVPRRAW